MAASNTLIAGIGPRIQGIDPNSGQTRWESVIASPRSTNEVERLADVVDNAYRRDNTICVRAYQAGIGCVDAYHEKLLWNKPARGTEGLGADRVHVFATEADGRVLAFMGEKGDKSWVNEDLLYRKLGAPLALERTLVFGDADGRLYFLNKENGQMQGYTSTNDAGIRHAPVLLGNVVVAITANGGLYGYSPR